MQAAFYDDPRVLTISLHEHPATLWPGTGLPSETGGPGAEGSAANVALPARTRNAGWLRAFHAVVPPLLRAFRPEILVSQHGCNTHWTRWPTCSCHRCAARSARRDPRPGPPGRGRPLASYGGGGYELLHVVPRTWTHLPAEAAGYPINPEARIPAWREYVLRRTGRQAPELMTEGARAQYTRFESGYDRPRRPC